MTIHCLNNETGLQIPLPRQRISDSPPFTKGGDRGISLSHTIIQLVLSLVKSIILPSDRFIELRFYSGVTMTKLLERAFKKASRLPDFEQNAFAKWMLEELQSERKWEKAFAGSEDILDQLADEALAAFKRGETKPLKIKILYA